MNIISNILFASLIRHQPPPEAGRNILVGPAGDLLAISDSGLLAYKGEGEGEEEEEEL